VRGNVLTSRYGVGALIVLAAAALIALFPEYLDSRSRWENAMKYGLPGGLTLESTFCESGKRFPVITVREKLLELRANWDRGAIRDSSGKKIYFFHVQQHGNPSKEWQEMARKRSDELEALRQRYNVVLMFSTRVVE
jgi:hypothetical protein